MTKIIETLPEYFFHLEHNRCVTPGTLLTYKLTMQHFCELFGMKETQQLTPTHIHQFKGWLQKRRKRTRHKTSVSRKALSEGFVYSTMIRIKAYVKRLSERNYLVNLRPSDIPINKIILKEPVYLTKGEIEKIVEYLDKWVETAKKKRMRNHKFPAYKRRALVRMLYTTGLRNAEVRTLKMEYMDLDRMTGNIVGKGNKHGFFSFNAKAKKYLMEYLAIRKEFYPGMKFTYIFSNANRFDDKPINGTSVNTILREIGEKAGIGKRLHAHVFRHTCATHLLDAGANIREVQEKLRHANLDTTALYTHVSNRRLCEITHGLDV